MKFATTPDGQKRWMAQRCEADKALAAVKREELRALTEEKAAEIANDLALILDDMPDALPNTTTSGLVEQQRIFRRWRH